MLFKMIKRNGANCEIPKEKKIYAAAAVVLDFCALPVACLVRSTSPPPPHSDALNRNAICQFVWKCISHVTYKMKKGIIYYSNVFCDIIKLKRC